LASWLKRLWYQQCLELVEIDLERDLLFDLPHWREIVLRFFDSMRSSLLIISQSWFSQANVPAAVGTTSKLEILGVIMSWIWSTIVASLNCLNCFVESTVCVFVGRRCIHKDLNSCQILYLLRSLMCLRRWDDRWLPISVWLRSVFKRFSSLSWNSDKMHVFSASYLPDSGGLITNSFTSTNTLAWRVWSAWYLVIIFSNILSNTVDCELHFHLYQSLIDTNGSAGFSLLNCGGWMLIRPTSRAVESLFAILCFGWRKKKPVGVTNVVFSWYLISCDILTALQRL